MTSLGFDVLGAWAEPYAAVPTIMTRLRITEADGVVVHALALRCQIRIEPQRRGYDRAEEERLSELFGATSRWGASVRPFLWTHVSTTVPGFQDWTEVELPLQCTYDFEVAGAKYLHAVREGEVPLLFLFTGTVFTRGPLGFSAEPVPWDQEASYRLPVAVWRGVMDQYFPDSGWVRIRRGTLDELQRYKVDHALATWDQTVERLLAEAREGVR